MEGLASRAVGRAPPPGVLAAAEAAGLNVANLRTLLRECGEEGCARAVADMLELHSLMARREPGRLLKTRSRNDFSTNLLLLAVSLSSAGVHLWSLTYQNAPLVT